MKRWLVEERSTSGELLYCEVFLEEDAARKAYEYRRNCGNLVTMSTISKQFLCERTLRNY